MQASFLLMQQFENQLSASSSKQAAVNVGDGCDGNQASNGTGDKEFDEKIANLLQNVAKHKQRIAGKSLPFEKFTCCRVDKYKATGTLILPALELIHIWNGFTMFSYHTETITHFLDLTKAAIQQLERQKDTSKHGHDNISLCYLLQGICLRYLQRPHEAEESLSRVAKCTASQYSSKMDSYFPAWASAEIGFMYRDLGEKEIALKQLQHTLKNYSKYGLESRLHFRVHSGIEVLKTHNNKKKTNKKGVVARKQQHNKVNADKQTLNDVKGGDDDDGDEEFADLSGEQFQNDDLNVVDTVSVASASDRNLTSSDSDRKSQNGDVITNLKDTSSQSQSTSSNHNNKKNDDVGNSDVTKTTTSQLTSSLASVSSFQTPPATPSLLARVSEASSSLSPKHSFKNGAIAAGNNQQQQKDVPRLSRETAI